MKMCDYKRSYKRFVRLHKEIKGLCRLDTKLGKRGISTVKKEDSDGKRVVITYYDTDNSILFSILSTKDGLKVTDSKIGEKEIFDALYEAESLLIKNNPLDEAMSFAHMWGNWMY